VLLRGSGLHAGATFSDAAVVDRGAESGVPWGGLLLAFAEAAVANAPDLAEQRQAVMNELGENAMIDAAAVIGIFQAVVKIADATGIPLEDPKAEISSNFREELGLNAYKEE
jgi:hypothetical protein